MSGWQKVYLNTGDEATARAFAAQLGSDVLEGEIADGDENYCFTAYRQWDRWPGTNGPTDTGQKASGFYILAAFNTDLPEGQAAYQAVMASPYVVTPPAPSNVWL